MAVQSKNPFVLSINSISGGGKTTLAKALNKCIDNSLLFSFDDYEETNIYPEDYHDWCNRGADVNEFDCVKMADEVLDALTESKIDLIILDFPFDRRHSRFKDIINLTVFIDTPLDVAMARRILRDKPSTDELEKELKIYESQSRLVYLEALKHLKTSDLILEGTRKPVELIEELLENIGHIGESISTLLVNELKKRNPAYPIPDNIGDVFGSCKYSINDECGLELIIRGVSFEELDALLSKLIDVPFQTGENNSQECHHTYSNKAKHVFAHLIQKEKNTIQLNLLNCEKGNVEPDSTPEFLDMTNNISEIQDKLHGQIEKRQRQNKIN